MMVLFLVHQLESVTCLFTRGAELILFSRAHLDKDQLVSLTWFCRLIALGVYLADLLI